MGSELMTPDYFDEGTISIVLKHKGKLYAKGVKLDKKDLDLTEKQLAQVADSARITMRVVAYKKELEDGGSNVIRLVPFEDWERLARKKIKG